MADKSYTQEEADQFIIDCHMNIEVTQEKLTANPDLANAYNAETIESALGAAGHMGRPDIAEILLENGAEMEFAAATMLNLQEYVAEQLTADPALALSGGAHNIPAAFHAVLSDDPEMIQLLWDAGAEEMCKKGVSFAIGFNRLTAARWLLERGADAKSAEMMGKPIMDVVKERKMTEMQALLEEYL